MNRIDTLKQISKMIASGAIPNDIYSKFLSECPIGFMQEKDLFNYLIGNDESKEKAIEYINFVINHYKEQLKTPIEDTYFDSDVNRKGYILSIIAYLQTIIDTLIGSDDK